MIIAIYFFFMYHNLFIFSNCFILAKKVVNPEPISVTLCTRQEYKFIYPGIESSCTCMFSVNVFV